MPCAQSLFYLRGEWALHFVHDYIALGGDGIETNLPEHKFQKLMRQWPQHYGFHSLGVDRDRPIPWSDPVWYAQQLTDEEVETAKAEGLLL